MSQADYKEEILILKYIAAEKGYKKNLIDQLIKKQNSHNSLNNITLTREIKNKVQTKYIPPVKGNILPNIFRSKFKKINGTVAFRTSNNIHEFLRENHHQKTYQEFIDWSATTAQLFTLAKLVESFM